MRDSIAEAHARGARTVERLLVERPARQDVWAKVSSDDQDLAATWLGLSRWPWIAGARKTRLADALDTGDAAVHELLHTQGVVPYMGQPSPPY